MPQKHKNTKPHKLLVFPEFVLVKFCDLEF